MGDRIRPSIENEGQETGIGNLTCSFGANVEGGRDTVARLDLTIEVTKEQAS